MDFSEQAFEYAKYRFSYPNEMFEYILKYITEYQLDWDCGTGNGQVASSLSKYVSKVIATDISFEQLKYARKCNNIEYEHCSVENSNITDNTVNLITAGQSLHWFATDSFLQKKPIGC